MPGHIDDIVDSPEDAIVTVGRLQRAVVTRVWPIAPVTTLPILAVTRVVLFDVPVGVLPDRLKCAWPRVLDADVSGTAGPWWNFVVPATKIDTKTQQSQWIAGFLFLW